MGRNKQPHAAKRQFSLPGAIDCITRQRDSSLVAMIFAPIQLRRGSGARNDPAGSRRGSLGGVLFVFQPALCRPTLCRPTLVREPSDRGGELFVVHLDEVRGQRGGGNC
jgi:hypothetical protein